MEENSHLTRNKIQALQNVLELRMGTFEKDTRDSLSRIESQVSWTNGKVRKIVIVLAILAGITIGLGITDAHTFAPLLGL